MIVAAGLLLAALAALLWWVAARAQRASGLPYAPLRYDDARARRVEKALISHRYRLTGRPDLLLEERGHLIPVELKPTRRAPVPFEGDLLQLAAYCLLVEESSGQRPPYGILRYADQSWRLPFDEASRQRLLRVLAAMEQAEQAAELARSHRHAARCRGCSQRAACDQRLA